MGALNVRKNQSTPARIPEWQAGASVTWNDSVAAYAADAVEGRVVSVQAQFAQVGTVFPSIEIRAVAAGPDGSNAALSAVVLGSLSSQGVFFDSAGASESITFNALTHHISEAGIGIQAIHWRWEARLDGSSPWQPFALTHHKIYTLLHTPTAPWTESPFTDNNDTLLWTDVLEVACTWAAGVTTEAQAIERITRAVNALGGPLFEYDCAGGGASHYVPPATNYLDCTAFLDRLRGGIGLGRLINCVDCATIVSIFANGVGCNLSQSRMGMIPPFFVCNPIIAIGSTVWEIPCGAPGFAFHEVAWSRGCTAADQVSDACLQIESNPDPAGGVPQPSIATNERFGNPGDGSYRDRLAAPAGREACEPQPSMRQRRSVAAAAITQIARLPLNAIKALGETYAPALAESRSQSAPSRLFWGFFFSGHEIPGWMLVSSSRARSAPRDASALQLGDINEAGLAYVSTTLWAQSQASENLLHVNTFECTSQDVARQLMVRLLGEFQLPGMTAVASDIIGDLHFTSRGGGTLFVVGNHVHLVRAAGHNRVDVGGAAKSIVAHLLADAAPPASPPAHRLLQTGPNREAPVMYSMSTAIPPTRWYRFSSATGEFRAQPGRVTFYPAGAGHHDVTVLTVDPFKNAAASTVRVAAS